ncbi:MAG: hypothetical protein ABJK39_14325 [Hyphomicrobiales bacterium]
MKRLIAIVLVLGLGVAHNVHAAASQGAFFSQADTDNSISLDKSEFKTFIKLLASSGHKSASLVKRLRLYDVAWKRVNTDENDVITPDEIMVAKWSQPV